MSVYDSPVGPPVGKPVGSINTKPWGGSSAIPANAILDPSDSSAIIDPSDSSYILEP